MSSDVFPDTYIDSQKKHHRSYLWLAAVIVAGAFLLKVRSDDRVILRPLPHIVLPESCPGRIWFHVDCPGCGLTRSLIHLAEGNLLAACNSHRVGWLMSLAILGQFPYRWYALRRLRSFSCTSNTVNPQEADSRSFDDPSAFVRSPVWIEIFAKVLLFALLINWLLKLAGY